MRYINPIQFDPRYLIDTHRTMSGQAWNRHRIILASLGTPITIFYHKGNTQEIVNGNLVLPQSCYCALDSEGKSKDPDRNHTLCYGTGVLPGYDRYGYNSHVIATTSTNLTLTDVKTDIDKSMRISKFILSGSATTGTIETSDYTLVDFKDFTHFRFVESVNPEDNRNEYFYSIDSGATWVPITVDRTNLAAPVITSTFPATMDKIRFRIVLKKKLATSSSPIFVYIKFRYRTHYTLAELDSRFKEITIPATLASYSINPELVEQQNSGLTVKQDPTWWTLPESKLTENDVIMYLLGYHANKMYSVEDLEPRVYGKFGYAMSLAFKTKLIQHSQESVGVVKFLAEQTELLNLPTFRHNDIGTYYPSEKEFSDSHYKSNQP